MFFMINESGFLLQAGQVLKSERDQLAQLMAHLRQDYEAVERAKVAQQEELAALKERMKKKGAANNKMLVKVGFLPMCTDHITFHSIFLAILLIRKANS